MSKFTNVKFSYYYVDLHTHDASCKEWFFQAFHELLFGSHSDMGVAVKSASEAARGGGRGIQNLSGGRRRRRRRRRGSRVQRKSSSKDLSGFVALDCKKSRERWEEILKKKEEKKW